MGLEFSRLWIYKLYKVSLFWVIESGNHYTHHSAMLLWEDDRFMSERKPIDYYSMSFPTKMLPDIITWSAKAMPSKKKKMDEVELWNLHSHVQQTTRSQEHS